MKNPAHDIFAFYFEHYKVDLLALAVCEFDLFTKISMKSLIFEEIKKDLKINERPAIVFLSALCALGFLRKIESFYENTDISDQTLVKGAPRYMGDALSIHVFDPGYQRLKKAVSENRPQIPERCFNESRQEGIKEKFIPTIIAAMENFSTQIAEELLKQLDFSKFKHILDLGGGTGSFSIEALAKNPHLKATILEKNIVSQFTKANVSDHGLSERIRVLEGDIFVPPYPAGCDLVLLANILHGYSPAKNIELLREIHKYLPQGGGVLILELLPDSNNVDPVFAALYSVDMLIWSEGGRQYTEPEISSWLTIANFKDVSVDHSSGFYSSIFARV